MGDDEARPQPGSTLEGPPGAAAPVHQPSAESVMPAEEPSMASAGADGAPDIASSAPPPPRRSLLPAMLSVIGLILIGLLGVNLYLMLNPPGGDAVAALQGEAAGLRQRVATLEARPGAGDATAAAAAAEARVKTLADSVGALTAGVADGRTQAGARIETLDRRSDALDKRSDALEKRSGALEQTLGGLSRSVAALPKIDPAALDERIGKVQAEADGVKAAVAALPKVDLAPLETRLGALDQRVGAVEADLRKEGGAARVRAAPLAVIAQAMLQALDAGRPFAPELAALKALGTPAETLAPLEPVAAGGAPTATGLSKRFAAVRDTLVAAGALKLTGTMFDRVMASAQSVVKVRPAGAQPGDDPDAIASRIAASLDGGRFAAALADWDRLPEASKAASAAWADTLKTRVAAQAAADAVAASAIATLGTVQ